MLCDKCSKIHFESPGTRKSQYIHYLHYNSLQKLESSAANGCHLCHKIAQRWLACLEHNEKPEDFNGPVILRRFWPTEQRLRTESFNREILNVNESFTISCGGKGIRTWGTSIGSWKISDPLKPILAELSEPSKRTRHGLGGLINSSNITKFISGALDLSAWTDAVSACGPMWSQRADTHTLSLGNMVLAGLWYHNCLHNHEPCGQEKVCSPLPTRIIDVSSPQQPVVGPSNGEIAPYTTLSYTWGDGPRYKTTIPEKHLVPLGRLPLTFQEAIMVSHQLGFRYLWIDAVCILQDVPEDVEKEISSMDRIYRNSSLNIQAAHGSHAGSGLSVQRDAMAVKPVKHIIRTTDEMGYMEAVVYTTLFERNNGPWPIHTRGWILQEELLPKRTLSFGKDYMFWECVSGGCSEVDPDFRAISRETLQQNLGQVEPSVDLALWFSDSESALKCRSPRFRGSHYDSWYSMIGQYTRRSLTIPKDVLNAVAGLAAATAKISSPPSNYLHGLWVEDIQVGLGWYVVDRGSLEHHPVPHAKIPSWSWACQWGKTIHYPPGEHGAELVPHEGARFLLYNTPTSGMAGEDSGALPIIHMSNTSISLRGRLRRAQVTSNLEDWEFQYNDSVRWSPARPRWSATLWDPRRGKKVGCVALDSPLGQDTLPRDVFCFLHMVRCKSDTFWLHCLALVRVGGAKQNHYRRIGVAMVDHTEWFGHLSEEPPGSRLRYKAYDSTFETIIDLE